MISEKKYNQKINIENNNKTEAKPLNQIIKNEETKIEPPQIEKKQEENQNTPKEVKPEEIKIENKWKIEENTNQIKPPKEEI